MAGRQRQRHPGHHDPAGYPRHRRIGQGPSPTTASGSGIDSTYQVAVAVIGETPYAEGQGDRSGAMGLDNTDLATLTSSAQLRGAGGRPVLVSGRPLDIAAQLPNWAGLVAAWLPGTEGRGWPTSCSTWSHRLAHCRSPGCSRPASNLINDGDGKTPLFPRTGSGLTYSAPADTTRADHTARHPGRVQPDRQWRDPDLGRVDGQRRGHRLRRGPGRGFDRDRLPATPTTTTAATLIGLSPRAPTRVPAVYARDAAGNRSARSRAPSASPHLPGVRPNTPRRRPRPSPRRRHHRSRPPATTPPATTPPASASCRVACRSTRLGRRRIRRHHHHHQHREHRHQRLDAALHLPRGQRVTTGWSRDLRSQQGAVVTATNACPGTAPWRRTPPPGSASTAATPGAIRASTAFTVNNNPCTVVSTVAGAVALAASAPVIRCGTPPPVSPSTAGRFGVVGEHVCADRVRRSSAGSSVAVTTASPSSPARTTTRPCGSYTAAPPLNAQPAGPSPTELANTTYIVLSKARAR